jgi:allantoinase
VNTSDICKELGLTYHCDYMNDEQPYLINTGHGPLVSIP